MRYYSIDTLKFICAVCVIAIHSPQPEQIQTYITPLLRCAVPVFFMISGYFTYGKKDIGQTIIKRVKDLSKVLCWALALYILCFITVNGRDSLQHILHLLTPQFLIFNSVPHGMHLWYIAAYIYVLAIIYFIDKFNLYKILFYSIPLLMVSALLFGKYSEIIFAQTIESCYTRNFLFTGLPFFATGMLMKSLKRTKQIIVPLVAFILFYTLGILETRIPNLSNGDWYATTIPLSISMFMFFTNIQQSKDNVLSKSGREDSFYIYIFHFLFAIIVSKIYEMTSASYLPYCSTLMVFTATMLFIHILRKTKIIGKLI